MNTVQQRGEKMEDLETCSYCKGEGKVLCPTCLGKGEIEIIVADDTQILTDGERHTWEDCPTCLAEQEIPCPECKGLGRGPLVSSMTEGTGNPR